MLKTNTTVVTNLELHIGPYTTPIAPRGFLVLMGHAVNALFVAYTDPEYWLDAVVRGATPPVTSSREVIKGIMEGRPKGEESQQNGDKGKKETLMGGVISCLFQTL